MDGQLAASTAYIMIHPGDSLGLWERLPGEWQGILARRRAWLQEAAILQNDQTSSLAGEPSRVAFHNAPAALGAARQTQQTIQG